MNKKSLENKIKGYPFALIVNRLNDIFKLERSFDDFKKIKHRANVYYGKIDGIDVAVYFSSSSSPSVHAKTPEKLNRVYARYLELFT